MKEKKKISKKLIVLTTTLIIIIGGISGCIQKSGKHVTHLGVATGVLEKDSVKVFYRLFSPTQKSLAQQGLDIIYTQYEICSEIMNLSIENLFPCSMVFCKSRLDPYILRCEWFAYVDGVLCWPIIGEKSMEFKSSINGWMLYHLLPHEIVDISLRERDIDPVYGGWFIEGVGEYARLMCANTTGQLNGSFFLNIINKQLESLSEQEERIVDLSNRSSFAGFGAPGSEDEHVFYVGSLTYIYDLADKYGVQFISEVVANNCTSYEDIRSSIENSTGCNISDSIKNVLVGWIKQRYILILEELNIGYQ